jgi:hypothetical protein
MRGTIVLLSVLLATSPATAQEPGDEAVERFDKGVELYKQGNFGGALVEFRAAYEAKPHHKVLFNIGMTLFKLNRYVEAEQELEAYLEEAGKDVEEETRTEVEEVLSDIVGYIGLLSVHCNVEGSSLHIDGKLVATLPVQEPIKLDVGEYYLEVSADGHRKYEEQITLPGGKLVARTVTLEPLPAEPEEEPCRSDDDCNQYEGCHSGMCVPESLLKGRKLVIAGAVLLPGGLGAAIAGMVMLGFSYEPRNDALLWSGGMIFLAGAICTIIGVPVLIVGSRRQRKLHDYRPKTAVTLHPMLSPSMLGLAGTF